MKFTKALPLADETQTRRFLEKFGVILEDGDEDVLTLVRGLLSFETDEFQGDHTEGDVPKS